MNNRFQEIYESNEWVHGSGEGSLDVHTRGYRAFLQNFLAEKQIRSVVDMGCGDWQFSQLVDWRGIDYRGYDVAPFVIERNSEVHGRDGVAFALYSGDAAELPAADLLIAKDVLQHLPNQAVLGILPHLAKYKYALLTNCTDPKDRDRVNGDIPLGGFRYLDLRLPPFNLEATLVYTFVRQHTDVKSTLKTLLRGHPSWKKHVLLVDNSARALKP